MSRYLAIDLEPQGLFVVAGTARGGTVRVEAALSWVAGSEQGPPTLTADTATAMGEQLAARLKEAGIAPAPVLVGIGRDKVILKELRYPAVPPTEEPALVRFQAMKELTESADDVVLDYAPLNGSDAGEGDRRSMAVIVRKDYYNAVQAMCAAAGLKVATITPRPFAAVAGLTRAFATGAATLPDAPNASAAVLTLGPQGGEFTVTKAGQVIYTGSIQAPDVANEAMLLGVVRRRITTYAGQNPGDPIRGVFVPEADDAIGGWGNRLRTGLPVPVQTYDPLAGAPGIVPSAQRGRFAGAAGLLAGKATNTLPINFASPRQPRPETNPYRKQFILAGAAAGVLFLIGAVFGYLMVDNADDEVEQLKAEKARLEKDFAALEPDQKLLDATDQWVGRGVNYLDELYEGTNRLPAGDQVRVLSFKGDSLPVDKDGKQVDKDGKPAPQAQFTTKVAVKPGTSLSSMLAIDGTSSNKTKYYSGTHRVPAGTDDTSPFKELFLIRSMVYHRPPTAYTDMPAFTPLPRRVAGVTQGGQDNAVAGE